MPVSLAQFKENRRCIVQNQPPLRMLCQACLQPDFSCYCSLVRRFDPGIEFVILIHPLELRRRIATGRMSYLCLENARILRGADFSRSEEVEAIIHQRGTECMVLYPGPRAVNLSILAGEDRRRVLSAPGRLVVFVLDGTWSTAKKMLRVSPNLAALPQICFTREHPSTFRVRKQPRENCYSTIEAIHQVIELAGPARGFETASRKHDVLLSIFDRMVEHHLAFVELARKHPEMSHFRHK